MVHQKIAQDSSEDDEIAMDPRSESLEASGHSLAKHGRAVRSPVFSLASL